MPKDSPLVNLDGCEDARAAALELGHCARAGGFRVLNAALTALQVLVARGAFAEDAVAQAITDSISCGVCSDIAQRIDIAAAYARQGSEYRAALFGCDCTLALLTAMSAHKADVRVQFACMKAASDIIGESWVSLQGFIRGGGIQFIEAAMQRHPEHDQLQLKAIRQFASAASWPETLCQEARFVPERAIALTKQAMLIHSANADIQFAGMEALSVFVGTSDALLDAFFSGGGLLPHQEAMQRHPQDVRVQAKAIKALAHALTWSDSQRRLANYCPERALALTKQAMELHVFDLDLQHTALERLMMYLPNYADAVARCGGGDLLKRIMIKHHSDRTVRRFCIQLLNALGDFVPSVPLTDCATNGMSACSGGAAPTVELRVFDINI